MLKFEPAEAVGPALTVMALDTLPVETVELQALDASDVMVMVAEPAVVRPDTLNVPEPATVTVMVAVRPVADGKLLL